MLSEGLFVPTGHIKIMEEEIAILIKFLGMGYFDAYNMPCSRRKRLLEWNSEIVNYQNAKQQSELGKRKR